MSERRVLHLIDTGGAGGAETVMLRLLTGLDSRVWNSVAVVPFRGWLSSALEQAGAEVRIMPSSRSFDAGLGIGILRLALAERADLIQTHLFTSAVYGNAAARLLNLPVVSTIHGEIDIPESDRWLAVKSKIMRRSKSWAVAVTESIGRRLTDELDIDESRVRVIPNGVDLARFQASRDTTLRTDFGWTEREIVVGALGNVRPPKDYATFLHAAAMLREREDRFRFLIVGDTEAQPELARDLLELRDRLGLRGLFAFAGFKEDVNAVLNNFDVYVMSSSREGLPLAMLQAMAVGLPVVATRSGGPQEVIEDGKDGLLVPPSDPGALAKAVLRVGLSPALGDQIGEAAREKVARAYSVSAMVRNYERLYLEALNGSTGRRRLALP